MVTYSSFENECNFKLFRDPIRQSIVKDMVVCMDMKIEMLYTRFSSAALLRVGENNN